MYTKYIASRMASPRASPARLQYNKGIVLYEIAILLTQFMKEYFNSFDDIQLFHTFSSISRDM